MKKLFFTAVLIIAIALNSFAKGNDKNKALVNDLKTALGNASASSTFYNGLYKEAGFHFNGQIVYAFYDVENEDLVGFSIPMSQKDLPVGAIGNIKKKYSEYAMNNVIMFIDKSGFFGFYVSLSKAKKPNIVISVNTGGKARYFAKM